MRSQKPISLLRFYDWKVMGRSARAISRRKTSIEMIITPSYSMVKKILLYRFPYKCMGRMIPIQSGTISIEEKRPISAGPYCTGTTVRVQPYFNLQSPQPGVMRQDSLTRLQVKVVYETQSALMLNCFLRTYEYRMVHVCHTSQYAHTHEVMKYFLSTEQ